MDNVCPYFKTSEEKHTIKRVFAMEHILSCEARARVCPVPQCGFIGTKPEMESHRDKDVVRHNELLTRAHRELLADIHGKPEEAGNSYTKDIVAVWSLLWKIEDFHLVANRANSRLMPLMSKNFKKGDQVWRLLIFPDESNIYLQLRSSPQEPLLTKATIAVQDCGFSFPALFLKEKEMVGGKIDNISRYHGDVEVNCCVTLYDQRKQPNKKCTTKDMDEKRNEEVTRVLDFAPIIERLVEKLEEQGEMAKILERADQISRNLSKDFGRGGKVGDAAWKKLDETTRKVFEARTRAPQSLGDEVDDIVSTRFFTPHMKSQIEQMYTGCGGSNDTGLNLRILGNKSSYISGSIIMFLNDAV